MKRLKTTPKNESHNSELKQSVWGLFNEMNFLQNHIKLRKTRYRYDKIEDQPVQEENVFAKFKIQQIVDSENESRVLITTDNDHDYKFATLDSVDRKSTIIIIFYLILNF